MTVRHKNLKKASLSCFEQHLKASSSPEENGPF